MLQNVSGGSISPFLAFGVAALAAISVKAKKFSVYTLSVDQKLLDVVDRYLGFIKQVSQGTPFSQSEVEELIAPDCKKILNQKLFTTTRDAFISDLLKVNREQGSWTVTKLEAIPASPFYGKCVTLQLGITMDQSQERFNANVLLRFDSGYRIAEIDEVFAKADGSYNF